MLGFNGLGSTLLFFLSLIFRITPLVVRARIGIIVRYGILALCLGGSIRFGDLFRFRLGYLNIFLGVIATSLLLFGVTVRLISLNSIGLGLDPLLLLLFPFAVLLLLLFLLFGIIARFVRPGRAGCALAAFGLLGDASTSSSLLGGLSGTTSSSSKLLILAICIDLLFRVSSSGLGSCIGSGRLLLLGRLEATQATEHRPRQFPRLGTTLLSADTLGCGTQERHLWRLVGTMQGCR